MEKVIKERAIDNEFIRELIKDEPSFEVLSLLLKQGSNINAITQKNGFNYLMDILHTVPQIKKGYKPKQELIKFLIDNGADGNLRSYLGWPHLSMWGLLLQVTSSGVFRNKTNDFN